MISAHGDTQLRITGMPLGSCSAIVSAVFEARKNSNVPNVPAPMYSFSKRALSTGWCMPSLYIDYGNLPSLTMGARNNSEAAGLTGVTIQPFFQKVMDTAHCHVLLTCR